MVEALSLEAIERIVKSVHGIKDIVRDENSVSFVYHDKDGDDVRGFIQIIDKDRNKLSAVLSLGISESHAISGLVASNAYNQRPDIFGTYSYCCKIEEDKYAVILESDFEIFNPKDEKAFEELIQGFIDHINLWESKVAESIAETGPDSKFMKGGFWSKFTDLLGPIIWWVVT